MKMGTANELLLEGIQTQNKLRNALRSLYELLETYSPPWYEKRYHDQAEQALRSSDDLAA